MNPRRSAPPKAEEWLTAPNQGAGEEKCVPARPVALTALTGRDTEVSLLRDRWEQAQEGMGQVVLIVGEAGLGKSRLVHTIKQIVTEHAANVADARQDYSVVEWRCSPRFQDSGLFPMSEYLADHLNFADNEATSVRFERLALYLDGLGLGRPEAVSLFAKLSFLPSDERFPADNLTPVRERQETFRAMHQWLKACSDRQPLLFIIEDLHWIDASTLEFLGEFIAEGLHDRILTVLTFRPEFTTPWPAVAHQTSIALNRLTRRQVGQLMRRETEGSVADSLVAQIYERTRGVPLFVEEFTRIVRESGAVGGVTESGPGPRQNVSADDIPATLQDIVIARVRQMEGAAEVAKFAAALGPEFSYELLAAVAELDQPALDDALAKLIQAEILYQKAGGPRQCSYTFKHALLEAALYDALVAGEREQLHRRIAEVLEAQFPYVAETRPELLAHHFSEADLCEKAASYWLKAGLRALERSANVEAIGHLTKGLALVCAFAESPERDAQELQFLSPLGTSYMAAYGYAAPENGPVFLRARELADRIGLPAQRFAVMWGNWAWHVVRGDFKLCMELAAEAVPFVETLQDPGMTMEALFLPGLTLFYRGDFAGSREHCERAVADYDDRERTKSWTTHTGQDSGVTHRCYLALSLWHLGCPDQALEVSRETIELARSIAHPFSVAYALHHSALLYQLCGLGIATAAVADEQINLAIKQGFPFWHATGMLYRGGALMLQGDASGALPFLVQGLESYRATGAGLALPYYHRLLIEAYTRLGRYAEARRALDDGLSLAEENDDRFQEAELHRLAGELHLAETDNQAAAEACFRTAIEIARRQQSKAWELRATTSLARLWRRQHHSQQAYEAMTAAYGQFTEGFTTPDLVNAAGLLQELGNDRMRKEFADGVAYVRACIPPPMEGKVAIDWRYIPSSNLGGDTIGYHRIDDDQLALYLIDVTGHGLDAALFSITIGNVIRSGSIPGADVRRPAEVLRRLNESFQGQQHSGKFFTIWYGIYCSSTRMLTWSGGGHHPSLLFAESAPPVLLPSTGPMMGVLQGANFAVESCLIPPGGRLLIFSDGVYELRRDKRAVWDLSDCIDYLTTISRTGESMMDSLLNEARHLRGSHQLDDDFSIIEARLD